MAADLRVEHFAINVADPVAMAQWYCQHLNMQIVRQGDPPDHTHFMADASGRMLLEIYNNPQDQVPDYSSMHPQILHIAFATEDAQATHDRLVAAGAEALGGVNETPRGDHMAMLRDPWGLVVQLCQRAESMPS